MSATFNNGKQDRVTLRGRFLAAASLVFILSMLLAAAGCRGELPRSTPPAASPTPQPPAASPSRFQVIDDGAALPPQVVAQAPAGGQELGLDGQIEITFDQPMDPARTASAWQLLAPDGQAVQGEVFWPTPRTLRFTTAEPLLTAAMYRGQLSTQAASAAGVALDAPLTFDYTTVGELQVSQVFPAGGAREVENNAVITVIFNRPVVPLVIAEEQAGLPQPLEISPALQGHGEWINTSVYAFRPEEPLRGATTYTVTVKAGLADATADTQLAADYDWRFTTLPPRIRSFSLSNGLVNPENNYRDVRLDEFFAVQFMQPMDPASVEAGASLSSPAGEPVGFITAWNEDFTQVEITPTQRLALGAQYLLQVSKEAQAADGGGLQAGLNWRFNTVLPPAVQWTTPADGETQVRFEKMLSIHFASPMDIASVKERIEIFPPPAEPVEWWYDESEYTFHSWSLQPSTDYEIRLLAGMQDIYGNSIPTGQAVRFQTTAYEPSSSLAMPWGPALMRLGGPQEVYVSYRNVSSVDLSLYHLSPQLFQELSSGTRSQWEYQPPAGDLAWEGSATSTARLNQRQLKRFQLTGLGGDELDPGFYYLLLRSNPPNRVGQNRDSRLVVVATANLTMKTATTEALLWLTGLQSGQPLPGVPLIVYDSRFNPVGQGVTGPDGRLALDLPAPADPYEPRYAIADDPASQTFALASSEWGSGISTWDYGIWSSYWAPPERATAYVYTDRPIYRPGQPVYFKGIVRLDDDLSYSLPADSEVRLVLESFEDQVTELKLPLSEWGSFSGEWRLDPEATLGNYTLSVRLPGQNDPIGAVNFSVAEYRKPEFQVEVSVAPQAVLAGDKFTATVQADYYSGGGVSGARVNWTLSSAYFSFSPPDKFSAFNFTDTESDLEYWGDYDAQQERILAEGEGQVAADGRLTLELPADLLDATGSRQLVFEATVTDLAGSAVSGRASLVAHRSAVYVGARPQTYVAEAGKEQTFELAALDWDGNPLAGQALAVEIVERRWYSVQEQDAEGRIRWTSSVEEIPVASFADLTTGPGGRAEVRFTPPNGGIFRARVSGQDAQGNAASASAYLWVAGDDYIPWRQTNDRSFELVADKKTYTVGDTAEILIASPFQGECYALVSVERGHVQFSEVVRLESNSTLYRLPITSSMAPNIYFSVVIVKGIDETNPRPNFKMAILTLEVDTGQQALTVELAADRTQAGPGEEITYTVTTRDYTGQGVPAEVSLGLSDLATLSLASPNSPPLLTHFYSRRNLGVWTSVPIVLSLEDFNAELSEDLAEGEGMGSGGGKGGLDWGVIPVRGNFPDTAYWNAHLVTAADGSAQVTVRLPDNLTTWRMDARAVTEDTRVGQTTLDILSTRPLLVRPQTPRFFVAGDRARLGAAVHNNTAQERAVDVSLQAEGVSLESPATQTVTIPAREQAYVTWEVSVGLLATRVDLVFSAQSGELQDASLPPAGSLDEQGLPVYRFNARETVGTSGLLRTGGALVEAISLPTTLTAEAGDLTVQVAPSLAAGMTDALTYLEHYPYECTEQTISRFLPNVISTRALRAAGLSDPALEANLQAQVDLALQRLRSWQNSDGGWGWWKSENSDPLTSAYVLLGLVEAQEAGYAVGPEWLGRVRYYLERQLKPLKRLSDPYLVNRQAFLLYVLARSGFPDVSRTVQLFEQRQALDLYARAHLAHTLYLIDPDDPRLKDLLSDLATAAVLSASGAHWEEAQADRWNWNSDTRTTAIVLSAVSLIDPQNPLNANAVRWLMSNRSDGHWQGTQETAWVLMALTNWMVASGELQADYEYGVALNGQQLGGGRANSASLRQTLTLRVDVAELLAGQANRLAFAREDGPGSLYYTAFLDVSLPVEEIQALDRGIVVSRSYYRPSDPNTPVTQAEQGELLWARLTIVAPNALHYVVVDDPLPAGLEAVDGTLLTNPQAAQPPQSYAWDDLFTRGWGWWYFNHIELRDEKVVLSASYLPAGTYVYTYMVRAGTPGEFRTIPPVAQEFYFPDVYGRGEGGIFTVAP